MLNLNDLFLFVQIVEHGGLTAAGRALRLPKSTLSKRLLALEQATATRLVQRTSRTFVVTEIGQEVYRHAAAMLIEAEAAAHVIEGRRAEPSGTVRITAPIPTAQDELAELLPRLALAFPKIRIVLHATDRFVDVVQEGFDLAIRAHRGPLPDSGLAQRRLGFEPNWLVASPVYLARAGVPKRPAQLDGADGIVISPSEAAWTLERGDARVTVTPSPRYYADESTVMLAAALAGLGVASLRSQTCRASLDSGKLVRVLPRWTAGGVTTTLLMPHRRGQLPSVKAVADALVEALSATADARTRSRRAAR